MNELTAYKHALHHALQVIAESEPTLTETLLDLEQALAFLEHKYNYIHEGAFSKPLNEGAFYGG